MDNASQVLQLLINYSKSSGWSIPHQGQDIRSNNY